MSESSLPWGSICALRRNESSSSTLTLYTKFDDTIFASHETGCHCPCSKILMYFRFYASSAFIIALCWNHCAWCQRDEHWPSWPVIARNTSWSSDWRALSTLATEEGRMAIRTTRLLCHIQCLSFIIFINDNTSPVLVDARSLTARVLMAFRPK